MERYLVTGGAGFIGSHLVDTLLKRGNSVRVLDDFDTGSRENLKGLSGNLEIIEGSVADPAAATAATRGVDYVLHQAARGSVPRSIEDPAGTHNANITGTLNILIAARDQGVKRVVCASSSSVYGETPELPKRESMMPNPKSPYALSKLTLEHYCSVFFQVYALETVALRYFNIYGPRQNPDLQYSAVIPIFISRMLKGSRCTIYGTGEQTRDFTYIEDCVEANLLACKAQAAPGKFYNIACGSQTSVNQLYSHIQHITRYTEQPEYEPARPGDVMYSFADITRANTDLGYSPKINLDEGLRRTVEWYKRSGSNL